MTTSAQKEQEMLERRSRVAQFRLGGVRNQRQIAKALGVSVATINRDFKALDAEWRERAAADIAVEKAIDLDRLDRLIMALWDKATKEGRWLATDRVLSLMQHRAKLLGLEAPQRREDTHRIEVTQIVQGIAESSGLDAAEILAEAERIVKAAT